MSTIFSLVVVLCFLSPLGAHITADFSASSTTLAGVHVQANPTRLMRAAQYALEYHCSTRPTPLEKKVISQKETETTLQYLVETIQNDTAKYKNSFRILNPAFLRRNFEFIRWKSDRRKTALYKMSLPSKNRKKMLPRKHIRLTSYAVFTCKGSYKKTKKYPHALYAIREEDEYFLKFGKKKFTKQQVLRGALEQKWAKKHVEPLVWLTRDDVEQALMQGSMFVRMPDGTRRLFNVHENNGRPYIKSIKDRRKQKIYWYFREIKSRANFHEKKLLDFIALGGAAFAGDLKNVGAGKLIAVEYVNVNTKKKELKLGVLADSGSAFLNNWNQLDLFAGIFDTQEKFRQYIGQFPDAVTAYILKRKS